MRRAAGLIFAIAVATACAAPASSPPPVTQTTPATSSPSVPTSAATSTPGAHLVWSQPIVLPAGDAIYDVVRWMKGYVASGQSTEAGGYVGATFASVDGMRWQRTATFDASPRLVATGSRLLAIASAIPSPLATTVWTSTDGQTWTRDARLSLTAVSLTRFVARGNIIIAAGTNERATFALWRSDDGGSWASIGTPSPTSIIRDVGSVDDGFLVIGRDGQPDFSSGGVGSAGSGLPAAWWSADGRAWTPAHVDGTLADGAQLTSVFRVSTGYLAVGSDATNGANPRTPALWNSTDGRDWRLIGAPAHWGLATSDGQDLIVFGYADAQLNTLGIWFTHDGRAWKQPAFGGDVADVPGFTESPNDPSGVDQVFAWPGTILVMGQRQGRITVWQANPI